MLARMTNDLAPRLDRLLATLPRRYPGPGGAIAILREGEVLARHAWGYANAERRIAFTPQTLFRMCSITKQFTCALVLEDGAAPEALDAAVRAQLPLLGPATPPARLLCHNQSGLRDYWAVAMLLGAPVEGDFGEAESARLLGATAALHFAPGTRYSYCNQNFRLLSNALEMTRGESFAKLLRRRIFDRIGMGNALLAADTRALPDGTEGYEGTQASGFRAATNRILWTGDAGLAASLDDMIAWERHIDATRDDPASLHARLAAPVTFADGAPAPYGFGLGRAREYGRLILGHGGALRGWRSHRFYVPEARLSVVVLFNHLSDAQAAALDALAAVLGEERPPASEDMPDPPWLGAYREPETGLAVRVEPLEGAVLLRYGTGPERLALQADGSATNGRTRLRPAADGLWMDRPQENQSSRLIPCWGEVPRDIEGRFVCDELGATLEIALAGGVAYGAFGGWLGQGRMELLTPIGPDLWALPCPRALDHAPPGDWSLAFSRDAAGRVAGLQLGCWLARGLDYRRVA
jgi:D-aminopeptidase